MKKLCVTSVFAGLLLIAVGYAVPAVFKNTVFADYWQSGLDLVPKLFGGAVLITGIGAYLFRVPIKKYCTAKTSGRAFRLSVFSALTLSFAVIAIAGDSMGFLPNAYKISTIPVLFSVLYCVGSGCVYVDLLRISQKYKRLFFDIPLYLAFLPPFMFVWAQLANFLAWLIEILNN